MAVSANSTAGSAGPYYGRNSGITGAPNMQASVTMAMRVRFTATTAANDRYGMFLCHATDLSGIWVGRLPDSIGSVGATSWEAYRLNSSFALGQRAACAAYVDTTTWRHVCVTYDTTNLKIYLDGVLATTIASATTVVTNAVYGRSSIVGPGQQVMQDVVFIARALTADEVVILAKIRDPHRVAKGDLFGWYPQFSDNFSKDYSGLGNDCSLIASGTGNPVASNEDAGTWLGTSRARIFPAPAAGAASNITATGTTNVTGSASMSIERQIAAAGTTNVTGSADLRAGTRAAGTTLVTGAAAMTALAQIQAQGQVQCNGAASMTALAQLAAAGQTVCFGNADITGTGPGPGGAGGGRVRLWRRGPRYGRG